MPAKKAARRRTSPRNTGDKLLPTIKKQGLLRGSGMFAAKQTGIKAMKTAVPLYLMVVGAAAATPPLGAAISRSVSTIPVVGELTNTAVTYGAMLRSRLGR